MRAAQHSVKISSVRRPDTKSLGRKAEELGDSDGAKRRMDTVKGTRHDARVKMWGKGLRTGDVIECERVGVSVVGGSYLLRQS